MIVGKAPLGMELIPSKPGRICVALQTHRQAALVPAAWHKLTNSWRQTTSKPDPRCFNIIAMQVLF